MSAGAPTPARVTNLTWTAADKFRFRRIRQLLHDGYALGTNDSRWLADCLDRALEDLGLSRDEPSGRGGRR